MVVLVLVACGESDTGYIATVVDSMRESIHAVRCDFLSLQGTQSERIRSMHIGFFACFHGISLERSRFRKIALLFFRLV